MNNTQIIYGQDELREWLKEQGFYIQSNYPNYSNGCNWIAIRRSKIKARRCECNEDKEGMQIVISPYTFSADVDNHSVEIEVCGESNGIWWKLMAYSIQSDELRDKLPAIEASLIAAWDALNPS